MSQELELPEDRLATTDEQGHRVFLYPADVSGKYRKRRTILSGILIAFFLILPWIQIDGHQAVWIDLVKRRFSVFGLLFWAHDAPILFLLIGGAAISIALITSIWGRIWCGWACPQTVFIDGVFRRIERWIEGDAVSRRRLDQGVWTGEKVLKKTFKWSLYLLASMIITHSFLAYFVGTGPLLKMITQSPAKNPGDFLFILATTALVLFDFGWFREQFCTIICPYGRFQSVLMDDRSLAILYDAQRGEPRRGTSDQAQGDCVNCYRCVKVCPTGVDIRRGVQLECIACSACADACDEVMTRLKKPPGLIRYDSSHQGPRHRAWIRPMIYAFILTGMITSLILVIRNRVDLSAVIVRAIDTPYQEVTSSNGDPEVINHFKVHLENQSFDDQGIQIALPPELQTTQANLMISNHQELLPAGAGERADLFVRFPKPLLQFGKGKLTIQIDALNRTTQEKMTFRKEIILVGPRDHSPAQ